METGDKNLENDYEENDALKEEMERLASDHYEKILIAAAKKGDIESVKKALEKKRECKFKKIMLYRHKLCR